MLTQDSWKLFPRLIEQKINHLLDEAEPNEAKAYQLYKTCKNENLWRNSFQLFNVHLGDFFSQPKSERVKSYFDNFLDRPMNRSIFDDFQLTFRTADVNSKSLSDTADWSRRMLEENCKSGAQVTSTEVLTKTLRSITSPPLFEKDHDIEFEDFCIAWKKTVFTIFGNKHDAELETILREIRWLNKLLKNPELQVEKVNFRPGIYLTQTEIDWTLAIQNAVFDYATAPEYPLSRGPEKERLIFLERAARLYNIIQTTTKEELLQHRESVRSTVLDQCGWLLRQKAS